MSSPVTLAERRWLESLSPVARKAYNAASPEEKQQMLDLAKVRLPQPWCVQKPHPKQEEFLLRKELEVLFGGAAGGSKALKTDTPIATPNGWSTMGQLQLGDLVFSDSGKPCRVLACSDVMLNRPCYEVVFSDGAVIVADEGHLWPTMTYDERMQVTRRSDEFRERRRAKRAKRGTGQKPWLAELNSQREWDVLDAPVPQNRTTKEIFETVKNGKRTNHSVQVCKPLQLPEITLQLDPYLLGVWLGDGTSSGNSITSADGFIVESFIDAGFFCIKRSTPYGWGIRELTTILRQLGVLNNKHIPSAYLRASKNQRLAMVQGLMDTDGTVGKDDGHCCFGTTSPELRDGMLDLLHGLGIKAAVVTGRAMLYEKDCGEAYQIKFITDLPAFRLPRKLKFQKRDNFRGTHSQRYIVDVRPVESAPVRCIQVSSKSGCFLAGRDMIPTHNSSALLLAALMYVDIPSYNAIVFRRSFKQLEMAGGLIHRSHEWLHNTKAKWNSSTYSWKFPSGATLKFGYLDKEGDHLEYQGANFDLVAFDELTHFREQDYVYLFSRVRKGIGVDIPPRMRCSANPGGPGADWVRRRFIPPLGTTIDWNHVYVYDCEEMVDNKILKWQRAFVPSRLEDNPHLDRDAYLLSLANLDPITRAQLLSGDWDAYAGGRFMEEWFTPSFRFVANEVWELAKPEPTFILSTADGRTVRYRKRHCTVFVICDPAATEKQTADWTAIGAFAVCPNNELLVLESVRGHFSIHDIAYEVSIVCSRWGATWMGVESISGFRGVFSSCERFNRWERPERIKRGQYPGTIPTVRALGGRVSGKVIGQSAKLARATPAIIRAQNGMIYLPEKAKWKQEWISEMVRFTGEDHCTDDQVDVLSHSVVELDRMGSGDYPKWADTTSGTPDYEREGSRDELPYERYRRHAAEKGILGLGDRHGRQGGGHRGLFGR